MALFDKNDVQIEFPYEIHHAEKEAPKLACPRCGHVQPRKKRVVCDGCNQRIPTEKSRQSWTNLTRPQDSYRKMAQVFFDDSKTRDFRSTKGNYGWKLTVRYVFITLVVAAVVMVPTVLGLRAYVGEKDWKKLEGKFDAVIGPAFHRVGLTPEPAKVVAKASAKPVGKAKSGKKSRKKQH